MNLYQKTKQYLYLRNKRIRNAFKLAYEGKLSYGDYFVLVAFLCIVGVIIALRFADEIDGIKVHAENMRTAAEFMQSKAIQHEATIASMLNGNVMINGRIVTLCQLDAAGQCRR